MTPKRFSRWRLKETNKVYMVIGVANYCIHDWGKEIVVYMRKGQMYWLETDRFLDGSFEETNNPGED